MMCLSLFIGLDHFAYLVDGSACRHGDKGYCGQPVWGAFESYGENECQDAYEGFVCKAGGGVSRG